MIIKQSEYLKKLLKERAAEFLEWFVFDKQTTKISPKINVVKKSGWDMSAAAPITATISFLERAYIQIDYKHKAYSYFVAQTKGDKTEMPNDIADAINETILRDFKKYDCPMQYFDLVCKRLSLTSYQDNERICRLDKDYFFSFDYITENYNNIVRSVSVFCPVGAKSAFSLPVYTPAEFQLLRTELKNYGKAML